MIRLLVLNGSDMRVKIKRHCRFVPYVLNYYVNISAQCQDSIFRSTAMRVKGALWTVGTITNVMLMHVHGVVDHLGNITAYRQVTGI